jgi:hypothetical protein
MAGSRRVAQAGAVTLGLVTLGLGAASVPLDRLTHQPGAGGFWSVVIDALALGSAIAVGTLIAARRPGNPIGWMLLAILILETSPAGDYAVLDYRIHHGTLPLGGLAVVVHECWPLYLVFIAIFLWIFPDGKLPAGRRFGGRRPAAVLVVAGLLLAVAASAHGLAAVAGHDVHLDASGNLTNPHGVASDVLDVTVIIAVLATCLAWLVFQIPTYRHAGGERRQQLKWLYSGAAMFLVALALSVVIVPIALRDSLEQASQPAANAILALGTAALPVCFGVAVLKYRLYDLGRIISRVVSYTVITALLGGVYAGLILLATHVLPFHGPVAVAAVTLITAALFNPLRKRVQHLVDRRFNRSRYNAEVVVAEFSARLRHTVDLDAVRHDLVDVVGEAFQPTAVSMWLAPGSESGG